MDGINHILVREFDSIPYKPSVKNPAFHVGKEKLVFKYDKFLQAQFVGALSPEPNTVIEITPAYPRLKFASMYRDCLNAFDTLKAEKAEKHNLDRICFVDTSADPVTLSSPDMHREFLLMLCLRFLHEATRLRWEDLSKKENDILSACSQLSLLHASLDKRLDTLISDDIKKYERIFNFKSLDKSHLESVIRSLDASGSPVPAVKTACTLIRCLSLDKKTAYPFYMNTPILFELYFLLLLRRNKPDENILYQKTFNIYYPTEGWHKIIPDFLLQEEGIILDTKYKPIKDHILDKDDIWQISGYARSKRVRDLLKKNDDREIPCVVVSPSTEADTYDSVLTGRILDSSNCRPDREYSGFHHLVVRLPQYYD